MPVEKSAGAIIFRKDYDSSSVSPVHPKKVKIFYLLLHYPSSAKSAKDYWDFPKGHIENQEKEIETVKREVKEETGLDDLKFVEGFKTGIKYFFRVEGRTVFKIVTFYLAQTETKEVIISDEHIGYDWLPYEQAKEQLTFSNARTILTKAHQYLKEHMP